MHFRCQGPLFELIISPRLILSLLNEHGVLPKPWKMNGFNVLRIPLLAGGRQKIRPVAYSIRRFKQHKWDESSLLRILASMNVSRARSTSSQKFFQLFFLAIALLYALGTLKCFSIRRCFWSFCSIFSFFTSCAPKTLCSTTRLWLKCSLISMGN